jgi:integrase
MQNRRRETPLARINPSGDKVWVARYTTRAMKTDAKTGRRVPVRKSAGTFALRGPCRAPAERGDCCAQHAIDYAYDRERSTISERRTVGGYADTWTKRHPRAERTNSSYNGRLKQVLDVELEGLPLRDWPMVDIRRRHAVDLLEVLLVTQRRSAQGAQGVLRVLSAMFEDAINDDLAETNPWQRVRVRASDPRVTKAPRKIDVWSWIDMHSFARDAGRIQTGQAGTTPLDLWRKIYAEPMVRVLSDCGLRLGELLPLRRSDVKLVGCDEGGCPADGPHLHVRFTAHEGRVLAGTKTDHGESNPGRVVPLSDELVEMLRALPPRIDTMFVFPTPRGALWRERNFYRDVWYPARKRARMEATPHEFRHSWISHLRAAGVDPADLAQAAGHTVQTATARYTHALGRSFGAMRSAVGE